MRSRLAAKFAQQAETPLSVFLLCAIFTLMLIFNYIFPLGALLFSQGIEGQDCGQMVWNLWHTNEAITSGHNPYFTDEVFYPLNSNLSHHTLAAGFFPVTFLVEKLSGESRMYPFYAYRVIIWLSFTLILFCSFYALRETGATRLAASAAAIAYAFCDFYILHALHLNHLAGFFIPLVALCLIRAYKQPQTRNILGAAIASAAAIYFTEFALYIYMAALLFALAICVFRDERALLIERLKLAGATRIAVALIVFVIIVAPFLVYLLTDKIVKPDAADSSTYSANLAGFFIPHQGSTPLYGAIFASLDARVTVGKGGFEVFAGFPLLIFAIVGLLKTNNRAVRIAFVAALLFFVLSLGTTLKIFGAETGISLPYAALVRVPPFDSGRTPVRFVVVGMFFLMIVGAGGMTWMQKKIAERWGAKIAVAAMLLVIAWTTAETYSPVARQQVFVPPSPLQNIVPGLVLNLPVAQRDGYAAMLQVFHHQPIATGYLARNSENQLAQFLDLRKASDAGGAAFCEQAKRRNIRNLLITPDAVSAPYLPGIASLELSKCSVNIVDLRNERNDARADSTSDIKRNGDERPAAFPLYTKGTRLDFAATYNAQTDQYLWYGWSGHEPLSRWTERGAATLAFALDKTEPLRLRINMAAFLAPGKLDAQKVFIEINDQAVAALTLDAKDAKTYSFDVPVGVLRHENVLKFRLPDAASPKSVQAGEDIRLLGIDVHWLELDAASSGD
ncbi:MAG: hypothetical protein ABR577_09535 [Pyrinomonadaceae bacterium]